MWFVKPNVFSSANLRPYCDSGAILRPYPDRGAAVPRRRCRRLYVNTVTGSHVLPSRRSRPRRAAPAGPGARARPLPSLQPTHGRGLHPLDSRVRALPRSAAPARDGRAAGGGVPVLAVRRPRGVGVDPSAGAVGAAVSLPAGARPAIAVDGRHRPPAAQAAAAGGAVAS